jgi:signal peptidase
VTGTARPPAARRRGALHRVADTALTVAAVLGTLAVVGALAAHLFGVRVALFASGSMSPAIDVADAALTVPVPAAEIRPGDVVTVDRPGRLPLTHRVVSTTGTGAARELVLRGDANAAPDPEPYRVREAHRVVAVVPRVAPVLGWFAEPGTLAGTTVLATGLVLWAFWPRRDASPARDPAAGPVPADGPHRVLTLAVAGVLVLASPTAAARPAPTEVVTAGPHVTLISVDDPAMRTLGPGAAADWLVGLRTTAPEPGVVTVSAVADDPAVPAVVAVDSCTERWSAGRCPGLLRHLVPAGPPDVLGGQPLEQVPSSETRWFRFRVTVPADAEPRAWRTALTVTATGLGDTVTAAPGSGGAVAGTGAIAGTGAAGTVPAALLAGAFLVAGAVLLLRDRARRTAGR